MAVNTGKISKRWRVALFLCLVHFKSNGSLKEKKKKRTSKLHNFLLSSLYGSVLSRAERLKSVCNGAMRLMQLMSNRSLYPL